MRPVESQSPVPSSKPAATAKLIKSANHLVFFKALRREQGSGLGPHDVGAVVISPTRELASQIFQVVGDFLGDGQKFDLKSLLFIGGPKRSVVDDLARFSAKGANVIVATPGRLGDILMGGGSRPAAASIADSDQQQQQLREHRNLLLSGLKKLACP